jgi:thiol-disulfide isomerase/thioredoxin
MNRLLQHPVALGLSAALLISLGSITAARFFGQPVDPERGIAGVRIAEVWDATLPDLAGRTQSLKQWQGKVVALNFWAPWCPPCREEIPGFIRLQEKYGNQGLQFIGIALDDPAKVQAYVDEAGIPYPILLGDMAAVKLGQAAGNRLGGLPYTLILDRQGNPIGNVTGALDATRLEALVAPLL